MIRLQCDLLFQLHLHLTKVIPYHQDIYYLNRLRRV